MTYFKEVNSQSHTNNQELARGIGPVMKGFMDCHDAALKDGALDPKTKELIALGISIAVKCEPCIGAHVQSLIDMGTSREEILETAATAIFMGGGPATVYGGKAVQAYDELKR